MDQQHEKAVEVDYDYGPQSPGRRRSSNGQLMHQQQTFAQPAHDQEATLESGDIVVQPPLYYRRKRSFARQKSVGSFTDEHIFADDDSTTNGDLFCDDSQARGFSPKVKAVTEVERIAKPYTFTIRVGRVFVFTLMFCLGALACGGTYFYLARDDEDEFHDGFFLFARTIQDAIDLQTGRIVDAFKGLSAELTAHTLNADNNNFPRMTMPLFEVNGFNTRAQTGVELVAFLPLVPSLLRLEWQNFSEQNQGWIKQSQSVELQRRSDIMQPQVRGNFSLPPLVNDVGGPEEQQITPFIYELTEAGRVPAPEREQFAPFWLSSPALVSLVNMNMLTEDMFADDFGALVATRDIIVGAAVSAGQVFGNIIPTADPISEIPERPYGVIFAPVFEGLDHRSEVVGFLAGWFDFSHFLANLLPKGVNGIHAVLSNSCNQSFTYCLQGNQAIFCGVGDKHDRNYDNQHLNIPFSTNAIPLAAAESVEHLCLYEVDVYASEGFEDTYVSPVPYVAMVLVAVVFFAMGVSFFTYDWFVQRRNKEVVGAAARSTEILSSLFPAQVRERLFAPERKEVDEEDRKPFRLGAQSRLRRFLNNENDADDEAVAEGEDPNYPNSTFKSKPIADLFPETTILFADISGFTAWSSVREPAQVFTLLETLYAAFDEIATRRRVFKVETVGDCYVAVTGLPDPRKDHAVAMARFARDCMQRMDHLTKSMEVELGPDTGDLCMRMGLHSGPVTAGVLRGDRARFQLFGDTMNTAARMESTGVPRRIQMSEETADLLRAAGKQEWIRQRDDVVTAKGKGSMKTFWLTLSTHERRGTGSALASSITFRRPSMVQNFIIADVDGYRVTEKTTRLIEWNVEVLLRLLKQTVARRVALAEASIKEQRRSSLNMVSRISAGQQKDAQGSSPARDTSRKALGYAEAFSRSPPQETPPPCEPAEEAAPKTPLEEVTEVIWLPDFDANFIAVSSPDTVEISVQVVEQLSDLVTKIAALYQKKNAFHNFEHASHVTMSVVKLLSRIVAPEIIVTNGEKSRGNKSIAYALHDHTYGITSDPLTQFACVFSALVHDVDHSGVPNTQLVKEKLPIAEKYKGKSVAEQNSVDVAWKLFMEDRYVDLRNAVCSTSHELKRLRQLVVNSVMATDILDKDLKALRNSRWVNAFLFESEGKEQESSSENRNRKATIVIEHMIQASDIAHTMQHWHIYRKWNERLFAEMAKAYDDGRAEKHPVEFWYQGEIGFFDYYIIPLAKKLKDCGVFGVSSDEYLNYALKNRQEWESRGQEVVSEMVEKLAAAGVSTGRRDKEIKQLPTVGEQTRKKTPVGARYLATVADQFRSKLNVGQPAEDGEPAPDKPARRNSACSQLSDSNHSRGLGLFGGQQARPSTGDHRARRNSVGHVGRRASASGGQFARRLSGQFSRRLSGEPGLRRYSGEEPPQSRRFSGERGVNRRLSGGWLNEHDGQAGRATRSKSLEEFSLGGTEDMAAHSPNRRMSGDVASNSTPTSPRPRAPYPSSPTGRVPFVVPTIDQVGSEDAAAANRSEVRTISPLAFRGGSRDVSPLSPSFPPRKSVKTPSHADEVSISEKHARQQRSDSSGRERREGGQKNWRTPEASPVKIRDGAPHKSDGRVVTPKSPRSTRSSTHNSNVTAAAGRTRGLELPNGAGNTRLLAKSFESPNANQHKRAFERDREGAKERTRSPNGRKANVQTASNKVSTKTKPTREESSPSLGLFLDTKPKEAEKLQPDDESTLVSI